MVEFYQWSKQATKKYPEKSLHIESGSEVLEIFKTQLSILKKHCFLSRNQQKYYKAAKENITADEALVHVNFSKNYYNKEQHATKSAYSDHQQLSIYTVATYYKEDLVKMAIITPDKDYSHVASYHLNSFILNKLKEKVSSLGRVTFCSDRCSSQFKSRHVFLDLSDLDRDMNLNGTNLEATTVDGIGGCVKQKIFRHVKSFKVVLSNAEEFASYAYKVVEGIDMIYNDTSQIPNTLKEALAVQVTATKKVRMIQHSIGTNEVKLSFYAHTHATDPFIEKYCKASSVSDSNTMDSEPAAADTLVSEDVAVDSDPGTESFQIGCWYAIYFIAYDYWFVGFAINILKNELVKMGFLQQLGQNINCFGAKEESFTYRYFP